MTTRTGVIVADLGLLLRVLGLISGAAPTERVVTADALLAELVGFLVEHLDRDIERIAGVVAEAQFAVIRWLPLTGVSFKLVEIATAAPPDMPVGLLSPIALAAEMNLPLGTISTEIVELARPYVREVRLLG